jgi:D-alanyl-D-alanine carboxypeptidase/D-alanyl-D-alanine-endopeptidase (penicillin-binding protein 4)
MLLGFAACVVAGATSAQAAQPVASATLARQIDAFIAQPQFARADWGIAVRSLDTGRVLYAHHADRLFVPASNAKLFTAGLAVAELGSTTRIATTLYATSDRVAADGTLRGDLILYGRGDPALGLADGARDWGDRLAAALAARGIRRVDGNLIADATYFSGIPVATGWEANDLQTWYGAVPSALNVAGNLVRVTVARVGSRCCDVSVVPDAAGIQVDNRTADTPDEPLGLYRPVGASTLYVIGNLPRRTTQRTYALSMPDPARAAGAMLRAAMSRRGIQLTGRIEVRRWPQSDPALAAAGTVAIASIESPSIAALVDHALKASDNLYAQSLWLQVGVVAAQRRNCSRPHPPDSSAGWAACALEDLLARAGIPRDAALIAEGAGLSRQDLVTPDALVAWLAWASAQPWGPNLQNALPVAGIDGTLQARFRQGIATAKLQAKTGTLSHAYTLAGFVTDAAGERLAFALMLNRYPRWEVARADPAAPTPAAALDAIARMLARHGNVAGPARGAPPATVPAAH